MVSLSIIHTSAQNDIPCWPGGSNYTLHLAERVVTGRRGGMILGQWWVISCFGPLFFFFFCTIVGRNVSVCLYSRSGDGCRAQTGFHHSKLITRTRNGILSELWKSMGLHQMIPQRWLCSLVLLTGCPGVDLSCGEGASFIQFPRCHTRRRVRDECSCLDEFGTINLTEQNS